MAAGSNFPRCDYVTISRVEFDSLVGTVEKLAKAVEILQEKLGQNSTNSSKPPSSDPPGTQKRPQRPSGQSRGGQPGHQGKGRASNTNPCRPQVCPCCGNDLSNVAGTICQRHQVIDLPKIEASITEHQVELVTCPTCRKQVRGEVPAHAASSNFGPGVMALLANLIGRCRMSRRDAQWIIKDLLGIDIGLGTLPRLEGIVSDSLGPSYQEVKSQIPVARVLGVDDSAWKERKAYKVAFIANTPGWAIFQIEDKKDHETAKLVLEGFWQKLVSDRGSTYSFYKGPRQTCLAHVDRHFLCIASRGGDSRLVGRPLLDAMDELWSIWKRYQKDEIDFEKMGLEMIPVQAKIYGRLLAGTLVDHSKTAKTCKNFLEVFDTFWEFTRDPEVPPTNNSSEQALRPVVRSRKTSFGSQSELGTTFIARIMTAAETCRRQGKNLYRFLKATVEAHLRGISAPLILAPD